MRPKSNFCKRNHDKSITGITNRGACKLCLQIWNKVNRKHRSIQARQYYHKDGSYYRLAFINHLKYKYNITIEEYAWLLYNHHFKCDICGIKEELHLDHCHKTGKIRGILCRFHNHLLGKMEVFAEDIKKLNEYIKKND